MIISSVEAAFNFSSKIPTFPNGYEEHFNTILPRFIQSLTDISGAEERVIYLVNMKILYENFLSFKLFNRKNYYIPSTSQVKLQNGE